MTHYIYQTNLSTGERLAFGPFTEEEALLVRHHCGGGWPKIKQCAVPKFPCYDNGDTLRRCAGLSSQRSKHDPLPAAPTNAAKTLAALGV